MPKLSEMFPSKFLKAQVEVKDGEPVVATIAEVTMEEFENDGRKEKKPLLALEEFSKPMVCNKTNATTISAMYGDDTDDWIGQRITLMSMEVKGPNGLVDSIVVSKRKPAAKAAPKRAPAKVTQADADEASAEHASGREAGFDDDIPW